MNLLDGFVYLVAIIGFLFFAKVLIDSIKKYRAQKKADKYKREFGTTLEENLSGIDKVRLKTGTSMPEPIPKGRRRVRPSFDSELIVEEISDIEIEDFEEEDEGGIIIPDAIADRIEEEFDRSVERGFEKMLEQDNHNIEPMNQRQGGFGDVRYGGLHSSPMIASSFRDSAFNIEPLHTKSEIGLEDIGLDHISDTPDTPDSSPTDTGDSSPTDTGD